MDSVQQQELIAQLLYLTGLNESLILDRVNALTEENEEGEWPAS